MHLEKSVVCFCYIEVKQHLWNMLATFLNRFIGVKAMDNQVWETYSYSVVRNLWYEPMVTVEAIKKERRKIQIKECDCYCNYHKRVSKSGKAEQVLYRGNWRVLISKKFEKVYYSPNLECCIGISGNLVYFFSEESNDACCVNYKFLYVRGKFVWFSNDGEYFGLLNPKNKQKIQPFCVPQENVPMLCTWTDNFYPVKVQDYYYLIDIHGNGFCRSEAPIEKGKNVFATKNDKVYLFGLDAKRTGCCVTLAVEWKDYYRKNDCIFSRNSSRFINNLGISFSVDAFGEERIVPTYLHEKVVDYYGRLL